MNVPTKDIRLLVKRVFITNDIAGDDPLPKWASWVKVIIDGAFPLVWSLQRLTRIRSADDLPLNVSRESLQQTKFLKQIKQIIVKHIIQLWTKIAEEDPEKFKKIQQTYGPVIKLGAVESVQNRDKLAALARFHTTQRESVSLDEVRG